MNILEGNDDTLMEGYNTHWNLSVVSYLSSIRVEIIHIYVLREMKRY